MYYLKRPIIYVDFDGVIKDTHQPLFEDYWDKSKCGKYIDDTEHVIKKDWIYVLEKSPIINDAIRILNEIDRAVILTRIHSLENEGVAKIRDLRHLGAKSNIVLVPYQVKKTDVVDPEGNVLCDDAIFNLDDWFLGKGISIFFDRDWTNVDGCGVKNTKYVRTRSLDILKKY